eukprot:TRINITY_DN1045_c0_g1_i2.p1 TRINITY_DN1045_c0_g1~~TRINITY_DN1045_c0_g1_i2.p1  ORF type:complete len:394 (-),score=68.09 TRINITY_DN1045_c0_g1_i2:131-1312(-)
MQDIQCTAALLQYYSSVRATIRGKSVYFQYSNRDEISSLQNQTKQETQNHILLVSVLNVLYNVDINILNHVFSKYGTVLKIVIFNKSAGFQALIQFLDTASAVEAKTELDGQNIYSGCCTLRIQYSSLQNLNVKYNNEKSRDFTNPNLPTTPADSMPPVPMIDYNPYAFSTSAVKPSIGMGVPPGIAVLIVSGLDPERTTPDILFTLFGVYGDVVRVKILHNKRDTALIQFVSPQQAETAVTHLNLCPLLGHTIRVNFSKHPSISLPRPGETEAVHLTKDYTSSSLHRYKVIGSRNFQHICPPSPVLHLSNLSESVTEETLRSLFSSHGTVTGFRFLPGKEKKMALIQMSNLSEAVDSLVYLHNYQLENMNLRISFSKATIPPSSASSSSSSS